MTILKTVMVEEPLKNAVPSALILLSESQCRCKTWVLGTGGENSDAQTLIFIPRV